MDEQSKYLVDVSSSGRVRPWKKLRMGVDSLADSLTRLGIDDQWLSSRAARLCFCSTYLQFTETLSPLTGELRKRLTAANFCRDRLCPMCQWRKSLVTFAQLSQIMEAIKKDHPNIQALFLTLTLRNCEGDELSKTIDKLIAAWGKMFAKRYNRKPYRVAVGWFRSIEVTYNKDADSWHPHLHAVLLVDRSYFHDSALYMEHADWVAEFRRAASLDYDPIVSIEGMSGDLVNMTAEVAKYAVKPGDWVSDDETLTDRCVSTLAYGLHGKRLVGFGGLMRKVRAELKLADPEQADLVNIETKLNDEIAWLIYHYRWQIGVSNYVLDNITEPENQSG